MTNYGIKNYTTKKVIVKPIYSFIKEIGKGYFAFTLTGSPSVANGSTMLFGIMDSTGKILVKPKYKRVSMLNADTTFLCAIAGRPAMDLSDIKGNILNPQKFTFLSCGETFCPQQFIGYPPNANGRNIKCAIINSKGKVLTDDLNRNDIQFITEDKVIKVTLKDGTKNIYQFGKQLNPVPLKKIISLSNLNSEAVYLYKCYGLGINGEFYRFALEEKEGFLIRTLATDVTDIEATYLQNVYFVKGQKNALKPCLVKTAFKNDSIIDTPVKPVYDSLLGYNEDDRIIYWAMSKNNKSIVITSEGLTIDTLNNKSLSDAIADYKARLAKTERLKKAKFAVYQNSSDTQKSALANYWEDTLLTGFIFREAKIYNKKYFSCIADSNANCTLLDSNLKTIIPYNKFSDIILSQDSRYASVASMYYPVRIKTYPTNNTDTTTEEIQRRKWGVYDLKNDKMILPFKYAYIGKITKEGFAPFNEGGHLYPHGQGGLFGVLNINGQIICKPRYTFIGDFNEAQLALAMAGGFNDDIVYGGNFIAINKNGENIKPNFSVIEDPLIKTIATKTNERSEFLNSKELNELMHFKSGTSEKQKDSLFALIYETVPVEDNHASFTEYGEEINNPYTKYDIYQHNSKVTLAEPLPSNVKYTYFPEGPVKNWGKYTAYQNKNNLQYDVFTHPANSPLSAFYSKDSIYISDMDTLRLDYEYPGIASQNNKVLNTKFFSDMRTKQDLYYKIYSEGLIYHYNSSDTLTYSVKGQCDSIAIVMQFCNSCSRSTGEIFQKTYYKKNFGLLVDQVVELPPVYKYITQVSADQLILIDTLNKIYSYDIKKRQASPLNETFSQFFSKGNNGESPDTYTPKILVTKTNDRKAHIYSLANGFNYLADSLKLLNQSEGEIVDSDGNVTFGNYLNFYTEPYYRSDYDLAVLRNDSIFSFSAQGIPSFNQMLPRAQIVRVNHALTKTNSSTTINKIKYKRYYYANNYYLLEVGANQYAYSNGTYVTVNSIKADSVKQIAPYPVYYYRNRMFISRLTYKNVKTPNGNTVKYYITPFDSAKHIEIVTKYNEYGNTLNELYAADGIIKNAISDKKIEFLSSNFKTLPTQQYQLYYYDDEKNIIRPRIAYLIKEKEKNYLCRLKKTELITVDENIAKIAEDQLEKLDSAQNFNFRNANKPSLLYGESYRHNTTYLADGILKSGTSFIKLPFNKGDSALLLSGKYNIEVYGVYTEKKWKIALINSQKTGEFKILPEYSFTSFPELKKMLYPHDRDNCEKNILRTGFERTLNEFSEKAANNVGW